jgi:hypothetical protein
MTDTKTRHFFVNELGTKQKPLTSVSENVGREGLPQWCGFFAQFKFGFIQSK